MPEWLRQHTLHAIPCPGEDNAQFTFLDRLIETNDG